MDDKLARLKEVGFVAIGQWTSDGEGIAYKLRDLANASNVLYAFAVDGQLKYVGKTGQPLRKRFDGYKCPAKTSSTNVKNNLKIRECLDRNKSVEVFALPDSGMLSYGGFHLNLAAGLEDSLVRDLEPPWNGGKKEGRDESLLETEPPTTVFNESIPSAAVSPPVSPSLPRSSDQSREPTADDFRSALSMMFSKAKEESRSHIEINAGQLHRRVGGSQRMPTCCTVMRNAMSKGDVVLAEPPKGNGPSVTIRYSIPRPT
jgi:hypothetical protein